MMTMTLCNTSISMAPLIYAFSAPERHDLQYGSMKTRFGVPHRRMRTHWGMVSRSQIFDASCAQVTIFQTAQRYALFLVKNVNSIVDVKVWIMGGVVLEGLAILMPSKAKKTIFMCLKCIL